MSFIWPPLLLLLLLVPIGAWAYRERERRRAARAAQFGFAAGPIATAAAPRRVWLRRLPAICTVAGITILVLSLARPQSAIGVPRLEGTVLLAFDISGSMAATDLQPNRMEAAKTAALSFIDHQPPSVLIGVVAFSDTGFATQVPTSDRQDVVAAIERLQPERGTSLGRGIEQALTVIDTALHPPSTDYYTNPSGPPEPTPAPTPVPAGTYEPAVIVLMTDGENTVPPDPFAAAQESKDRGVRIDTVGIGSPGGATLEVEGFKVHTQLDEATLQRIGDMTDGTYYAAADQGDLAKIYDDVGSRLVVKTEPFELTPLLAAGGFALLLVGGLTSLRWFGRMP